MIATVTSKGQVTLPAEARRQLKIIPGSKLEFIVIAHERLEISSRGGNDIQPEGDGPQTQKTPILGRYG